MTGPDRALPDGLAGLPLDHVAIAVDDLDTATEPYRLLGLGVVGDDEEVPGQGVRVRLLRAGDVLVELLAPTTPGSPVRRFLERRGGGLHHIALRVADLSAAIARLQGEGARFVDPTPHDGRGGTRVAFLHPSFANGVLVELVEV